MSKKKSLRKKPRRFSKSKKAKKRFYGKRASTLALLPILIGFLILSFFYTNCSKMSSRKYGNPTGSGGNNPPPPPGSLVLNQDKLFSLSPSLGVTGTYEALAQINGAPTNLPDWLTFDATTGTLSGIPRAAAPAGLTVTITRTDVDPAVVYAPIPIVVLVDPLKEHQWHLRNTGQLSYALTAGTAGEDLKINSTVAENNLGQNVRIAVSDTGVVANHPGLAPNLLLNESRNYFLLTPNWLGNPTPDLTVPDYAHGTAVAGLIAEKGWDSMGGRGAAPEAKFASFLFIQAQDVLADRNMLTAGLLDQFGGNFDIFNYSWGDAQCFLSPYPAAFFDKLRAGVTNQRNNRGSIYMIAAGNSYVDDISICYNVNPNYVFGNTNFSEALTTPYTIVVGALNARGITSSYTTPGSGMWIAAPGGEFGYDMVQANFPEATEPALITTDYIGCNSGLKFLDRLKSLFNRGGVPTNVDCHHTSTMNGTSGATPLASGVAALMLNANPNLTWRDVKYILAKTAEKIHPDVNPINHPLTGVNAAYNLPGHAYEQPWITNAAGYNFHNYYGFGRVNGDAAVAMAKNFVSPLGATQINTNFVHDSGVAPLNVVIPNGNATGVTRTMLVNESLTLEAVQLRLSISNCIGEIGVELTSPSGTKSILMNINSLLLDGAMNQHTLLSNAFYGENSAGTWTLKVIDGYGGGVAGRVDCTGAELDRWALNFLGF